MLVNKAARVGHSGVPLTSHDGADDQEDAEEDVSGQNAEPVDDLPL